MQTKLQTLVVNRDGQLDQEYLDALIAAERKELLRKYGKQALRSTLEASLAVGKGIVWLMTHDAIDKSFS